MATERPVINVGKSVKPTDELRKEFRARAAKVVSRGFVMDRLTVALPDDIHGEWIADDPASIAEAQALGFEIDKEYATKNKLHTNATGEAKVGDAVFMTMPKWMKEEIDTIKQQEYARHHGLRGGKPAEETQYASNIAKETPLINESRITNKEVSTLIND